MESTNIDPTKCSWRSGFNNCQFNHLPEMSSVVYKDSSPLTQEMVKEGRSFGPCEYKGPNCVYRGK